MSKALVIKGANFSANKLETVELLQSIPCTGVELSQTAISFTSLNSSVQLEATLTPTNTTDSVLWQTSNADCATVSNGLVTCVGVGSATITVSCGTQSASCTVVSDISIDMSDSNYGSQNGLCVGKNGTRDYLTTSSGDTYRCYYEANNALDGYKAFSVADTSGLYGIPIPKGTKSITILHPSAFTRNSRIGLIDANELTSYNLDSSVKGAKAYSMLTTSPVSDGGNNKSVFDVSEIDTAVNAFVFSLQTASGGQASSVTGDVIVTFS